MITRIAAWFAHEPVRTYLYTVAVAVLVVLNAYALVSDDKAALWGNLLAVVLVPAIEKARSRVSPTFPKPKPDQSVAHPRRRPEQRRPQKGTNS